MNRYEEIQKVARTIADLVETNPVHREAFADSLINLIGLMLSGVGKAVAVDGESAMNDPFLEDTGPEYARYLVGNSMQDATAALVANSLTANPDRYSDPVQDGRASVVQAEDGQEQRDRCAECNRVERFGHMHGCSVRVQRLEANPDPFQDEPELCYGCGEPRNKGPHGPDLCV